jgi:hypothetical protein
METLKNKNQSETINSKTRLKRLAAVAGLSVAAAMAPGVAAGSAEAAPAKQHNNTKTIEHILSLKQLENRTEKTLESGRAVAYLHGTLSYNRKFYNSKTHTSYSSPRQIENPLFVYRGSPKEQFSAGKMQGADYAFGSMRVDDNGKVHVTLHRIDKTDYNYLPEQSDGPFVLSAEFHDTPKGMDFGTPFSPDGEHIVDPAGNPAPIGLEYTSQK